MNRDLPQARNLQWSLQPPKGTTPRGRLGAASAVGHHNAGLVLFGGVGDSTGVMDETWTWDGVAWSQRQSAQSPARRADCAMAQCDLAGSVLLFGGMGVVADYGSTFPLGDTWRWDGSAWLSMPVPGPTPRTGASMAYDFVRNEVVLAGGINVDPGMELAADTWVWAQGLWSQAAPTSSPGGRAGAAMAFDQALNRILLFGGGTGLLLADTWSWDGSNWERVETPHSPPCRQNASMVFHEALGATLLYGGLGLASPATPDVRLNDTWLFDGQDWSQFPTAAAPSVGPANYLTYDRSLNQAVLLAVSGGKSRQADRGKPGPADYEFSMWTL